MAATVMVAAAVLAVPAIAVAQSQRFPDVPAGHYAFEAVEWAAEVGVAIGYDDGTFKPGRPLIKRRAVLFIERYYDEILQAEQSEDFTRGHMMVLLKAINDGTVEDTDPDTGAEPPSDEAASQRFPDVPAGHYAFEAVEWAAEVGVAIGYDDGTFKPGRPLIKRHAVLFIERYYDEILQAEQSEDFTRGHMMVLLKAINDGTVEDTDPDTGAEPPSDEAASQRFPDVPAGHYAFEAVEWAAEVGVAIGYDDGTFKPERPLIKRHAVLFIERYYDEILQAEQSEDFTRGHMMVLLKAINDGTVEDTSTEPTNNSSGQADEPDVFLSIDVGADHYCGVRIDASVACHGGDRWGQATPPAGSFSAVSAGTLFSCGLRTDGTVTCWGDEPTGETTAPSGTFSAVSAGWSHTCGVRTDGTIQCWGWDQTGQASPPSGNDFVAVSAGGDHSCGLRANGAVNCWGLNANGQTSAPVRARFRAVSAGGGHSCGLQTGGTIECWGKNDDWSNVGTIVGQSQEPRGTFTAVAAGDLHSCGLRTDGTIHCWGSNAFGQTDSPSGTFTTIDAGLAARPDEEGGLTCGLRVDGIVKCWGS